MKTSSYLRLASSLGAALRRALLLAPILLLAGALPGRAALIGYWKFDEGSGTNTADASGLGLNGTLSVTTAGAQIPQWITGRFGNALDFNRLTDANGGRVVLNNNTNLLLNGPFTISFWYRPGANVGSFPGPMRIGSQTATTGTTIGWGFFRSGSARTVTFKRGNVQPALYPSALTLGQWYHIVLRYGGPGATTNNAIIFGLSTNSLSQSWLTATATSIFEFGRMDQHDDCDLDDVAFWNEAVPLDRIYHTDNVPNNLSLDYNLGDVRLLWGIYDSNTVGTIKGVTWSRTNSLPGSTTPGDAYLSGTRFYVVFTNNTALTATAIFLGDTSPGGVGVPGTTTYPETPNIGSTARFVFDLSSSTTAGAGVNDLFEVTGNLVLSNNVVVVNPLSTLANGTYRLINYTGTKTGSLNPTVVHNSRYSFTIDESTPGQINLVVSGANASLGWFSSTNGTWDLATLNWTNSTALAASQFQQGDAVTFDESGAYGTNIAVSLDVWAPSLTINNSTNRIYALSGSGRIGGLQGGLTKQGNGIAVISNPNRFLGTVNINEGTLRVGNLTAFGATTGATVVASGAILDLNGTSPGGEPITVLGSGINNTGAVINTGAALVNNGLLGPVTMVGDLTIGGVNRWDMFGGKLFGNDFKLTKTGPPEIALSNLGDTGLGDIEVRQGQLTVLGSTLMGNPAKAVVVTNATFAHYASGTNIHNKPVTLNAATYNATLNTDSATNLGTVTLATGTNNVGGAGTLALLGRITGPAALNKNGAGILRLAGTNDYTGFTTVAGGTLTLLEGASIAASTNVTLAAGTVLDLTNRVGATYSVAAGQNFGGVGLVRGSVAAGAGASLSPGLSAGTLTILSNLSLNGDATLNIELGSTTTEGGGTNDLINVGGALSLSGTNTVKILPIGNLSLGSPYTFLNYTGVLAGGAANFNVVSDTRLNYTLDTASTPGKVKVSVAGGSPLLIEWTGGLAPLPTTWDTRNSGNWLGAIFGDQFFAGDTVVFNDFATEFSVTLSGDLYPANTQVEAEVSDYVFSGPGRIRGGGLNKSLAGKLTIANTGINDYPGATVIAAGGGTVQVGTGGNFGNLGPGPIVNDGSLILNRSDDITLANVVSGAGSFRKDNTNLLVLGASMGAYNGTINVTGGQLRPTATNGLGTPVGSTTIGPGATLQINGINLYAEPVIASGAGIDGNGAVVNNGAGQNNALMFLTLAGDLTVGGAARWDVRANPAASLIGNGYKLTKTNSAQFSLVSVGETGLGDIEIKQGLISVEGNTGLGSSGTLTVESNATLMLWGNTVAQAKNYVLNNAARIFKDNGTATLTGTGSLNGSNAVESASNAGADLTLAGVLSGTGRLTKLGAGNVLLTAENTYSGGTLIANGNLLIGNGATNGSIQGPVTVNAGALFYWLSNQFTLPNDVVGPSALYLRTPGGMILDGSKEINMTNGTVEVGRDVYGKLIIRSGANPSFGRFSLGNIANTVGEVVQEGGNVNLSLEVRVGHWPGAGTNSTYLMGGGSLNLTNLTNGLVVNASTEFQAILYLGVDGTGVFTQTGGVVTAQGIVLDNRGDTAGTDTFNFEGGTFNLGPYGIQSGNNNANTTYLVNLGGGTLVALTNWSSSRLMTLTGTNGDVTINTATNLVTLSGVLSGPGGFKKAGTGTLRLGANNTFAGVARVDAGTLEGNAAIGGSLVVGAAGTVSPGVTGTPGGSLTVTGAVTLGGTLLMEIGKTNTIRTNDVLSILSPLAYSGTLTVVATGTALASGDTFKLFNAPAYGGTFSSVTLPPLDPGLVWDLTQLPINGTIRVTDNLPPVAGFTSLSTVQNRGVTYAITKLVELARDPEGDPISFVSVGGSTNGAAVSIVGDRISYTPVLNFVGADRVSYVIADNRGGLNLGQLEVLVYPGNLAGLNILSVITVNGNPQLTFAGIPGRSYGIERAPAVDGPWTQVATVVCDPLGLTSYTDTNPPAGTSFYRTVDLTAP